MCDLPSINQVAILGAISKVEYKPHYIFKWQFQIDVPSSYGSRTSLPCGVGDGVNGETIRHAKAGTDWALINGKVRDGGFIQVRDLCIMKNTNNDTRPIHHVALLGEIKSVIECPNSFYDWQFVIAVHHEYGSSKIEATLTCGLSAGDSAYATMIKSSSEGQWAAVQGKVRDKGFIQVRSMSVFNIA